MAVEAMLALTERDDADALGYEGEARLAVRSE
jgi:hypothetical protein